MNPIENLPAPLLSSKILQPGVTKKELENWAADFISHKLESEPTIDLLEQVKRMQTVTTVMESRLKEAVEREYSGAPGNYKGLKIGFTNGKRIWDFTEDLAWNRLKTELDNREEFLKSLKEPIEVLDKESGEVITVKPPVLTYGKGSTSISLR